METFEANDLQVSNQSIISIVVFTVKHVYYTLCDKGVNEVKDKNECGSKFSV